MRVFYNLVLLMGIMVFCTHAIAQKPVVKKAVVPKPAVQKPAVQKIPDFSYTAEQKFNNGISVIAKGFDVKDAYLVFNDRTLVPENDSVNLKQQVNLTLVIGSGFKAINGKVFPGGSEKILWSNGEQLLESGDVFKAYDSTGVNKVYANAIVLKAVITEVNDKRDWFTVSFKVWDKKNTANEITGSYKLYLK